jgi:hypothetical protein
VGDKEILGRAFSVSPDQQAPGSLPPDPQPPSPLLCYQQETSLECERNQVATADDSDRMAAGGPALADPRSGEWSVRRIPS